MIFFVSQQPLPPIPHIKSEPINEVQVENNVCSKRKASPEKEVLGVSTVSDHGPDVKRPKQIVSH